MAYILCKISFQVFIFITKMQFPGTVRKIFVVAAHRSYSIWKKSIIFPIMQGKIQDSGHLCICITCQPQEWVGMKDQKSSGLSIKCCNVSGWIRQSLRHPVLPTTVRSDVTTLLLTEKNTSELQLIDWWLEEQQVQQTLLLVNRELFFE